MTRVVHVGCGGTFRQGACERCGGALAMVVPALAVDEAGRVVRSAWQSFRDDAPARPAPGRGAARRARRSR